LVQDLQMRPASCAKRFVRSYAFSPCPCSRRRGGRSVGLLRVLPASFLSDSQGQERPSPGRQSRSRTTRR
jgi:hypothetical protein